MATVKEFINKALSYEGSTEGDYFVLEYNKYTKRGIPAGSAWCAMFVSVVARQAAVPESEIPSFEGCITGMTLFKALGKWQSKSVYTPKPGDIVMFDWDAENNNGNDHTGIVLEVKKGVLYTIEGNAGKGICMRRSYPLTSNVIVGYGTPVFEEEKNKKEEQMTYQDFKKYMSKYNQEVEKAEESDWSKRFGGFGYATEKGLLDGTMPKAPLTREQAGTVLKKLTAAYSYIEDVPEMYREAVRYYTENGIVKGCAYDDGRIRLNLSETECRMLLWLFRSESADI